MPSYDCAVISCTKVESLGDMRDLTTAPPHGLTVELWADFGTVAPKPGTVAPILTLGQRHASAGWCSQEDMPAESLNFQLYASTKVHYWKLIEEFPGSHQSA